MKIRTGRLAKAMSDEAAEFTSSLEFDRNLFEADIKCNFAHTLMLKEEGIIDEDVADKILGALDKLKSEGYDALDFDHSVEDIHMALENYVINVIGLESAGFMHTAKSRNDQVATDLRLVTRSKINEIQLAILNFIEDIVKMAREHKDTVMVGYTHLQHAQPITLAHHLMAYAQSLKRDYQRLNDTYKRVNINPLGSGAMTTTSFPINRELTTKLMGFDSYMENSMDGVSSRDFISEVVFDLANLTTNLSKISEELVLWSSYEFGIIEMADEFSSTSSIMPQKKNPDVAEIARAKAATLNGNLVTIMTILKAIPYTYNRDLQEINPHLWSSIITSQDTLSIVHKMLISINVNKERCLELASSNFATATDLADIMVRETKIPFRSAHKIVGRVVNKSINKGLDFSEIDSEFIDSVANNIIGKDLGLNNDLIKKSLNPIDNVNMRLIPGGPSSEMVELACTNMDKFLKENKSKF
ncbi:MAG: argininosuccinate lyase [Methanobacteriaceae archaeon]